MTDIVNTPSYKNLHFSDYFNTSPTIVVPVGTKSSMSPSSSIDTTDHKSMCSKLLAGLVVVIIIYLVIKYVPKMFGGCGSGGISARHSATPPTGAKAVKSGDELDKIVADLKGDESAVVMFHAPWCGHCKATMPAYEAAAKGNTCKTVYLLADCHNDFSPDAVKANGIRGFPTIKKFTKSSPPKEHSGGRSEQAISEFACSK